MESPSQDEMKKVAKEERKSSPFDHNFAALLIVAGLLLVMALTCCARQCPSPKIGQPKVLPPLTIPDMPQSRFKLDTVANATEAPNKYVVTLDLGPFCAYAVPRVDFVSR